MKEYIVTVMARDRVGIVRDLTSGHSACILQSVAIRRKEGREVNMLGFGTTTTATLGFAAQGTTRSRPPEPPSR